MVKKLNLFATSGLTPYKTFFVDLTLEVAIERQKKTGRETDRLESGGQEFFKRIRQGFLNLCEQEPGRFILIDGARKERVIAEEIWRHMTQIWDIGT